MSNNVAVVTPEIVAAAYTLGNVTSDAHVVLDRGTVKVLSAADVDEEMLILATWEVLVEIGEYASNFSAVAKELNNDPYRGTYTLAKGRTVSQAYPPNWEDRPRVEPWNGHIPRAGWAERTKEDLLGIVELLNAQVTNAQQDVRDQTYLADWQRFRLLREVRIGARLYVAVTRAQRQGRKTLRIDELLKEATR